MTAFRRSCLPAYPERCSPRTMRLRVALPWRRLRRDRIDIMLPGLNGYLVCRTLREEEDWTPILMLTESNSELDEGEALDAGADSRGARGADAGVTGWWSFD